MTMYDYDEGPQLDWFQLLMGFALGAAVCGVLSILFG